MNDLILIATLIILLQLFDSCLRWLAFSKELSREQNFSLWKKILIWSVAAVGIYYFIFSSKGGGAFEYKLILMLGEIPFMAIFIYSVGGNIFRHIFVINLVAVWIFILHSIGAAVTVLFWSDGKSDAEIILNHLIIVVSIVLILLPVEVKVFKKIWLPKDFFEIRPQSAYIAFLPLIILMAHFIRLADDVLVHSWTERFSRIYLPFAFLFFYKYILETTRMFYKTKKLKLLQQKNSDKLLELMNYNKFLNETQESMRIIRHDLRHAYRLIYTLLNSGDIKKAQEFIITQKLILESAVVRPFCKSVLVNAALENFLKRAEISGINVTQKINIPDEFSTDEDDLALLIANVIKIEIIWSEAVEKNFKNFSLIILYDDDNFILEISDNFSPQSTFDSDGLPAGLDTDSIKIFLKKYNATTNLEKIGDRTKFSIYWKD